MMPFRGSARRVTNPGARDKHAPTIPHDSSAARALVNVTAHKVSDKPGVPDVR